MRVARVTSNLIACAVICFSLSFLVLANSIDRAMCVIDLTKPLRNPVWQYVDDALVVAGIILLSFIPVLRLRRSRLETINLFE